MPPESASKHLSSLSASAGDLSPHLLAEVFRHLLRPGPRQCQWRLFGDPSHQLRTAIILAATCRHWRQAAAEAMRSLAPDLELVVEPDTPTKYLSPLLGELVCGCHAIFIKEPQVMAPTLPRFLALARPAQFSPWAPRWPQRDADALGALLAQCTEVRAMRCTCEPFASWPSNLEALRMHLGSERSVRELTGGLRGLSRLTSLRLSDLGGDGAAVLGEAACFEGLHALRKLKVNFVYLPPLPLCFAGLAAAAARGVQVTLSLEVVWDSKHRRPLWAALAGCPDLHCLKLSVTCCRFDDPPSPLEQQLLASISENWSCM